MTTIQGHPQNVPTPTPTSGPHPPQPSTPGPRPLTIAPRPAELRPQDERQHGHYQHAAHNVNQTSLQPGVPPTPSPRCGPNGETAAVGPPVDAKTARFMGMAFVDTCRIALNLANSQGFSQAAETLDKHCQQAFGRTFKTGVISGVLAQAVHLHQAAFGNGMRSVGAVLGIGALLIVAETIPGLNVAVNYALATIGLSAAAAEIAKCLRKVGEGNSFAAGQAAGRAAFDALPAASSLKESKLLVPILEKLEGARLESVVLNATKQVQQVCATSLPTHAAKAWQTLQHGLGHLAAEWQTLSTLQRAAKVTKTGVESAHNSPVRHDDEHHQLGHSGAGDHGHVAHNVSGSGAPTIISTRAALQRATLTGAPATSHH